MALDLYAGTLTRYYADEWEPGPGHDTRADAAETAEARAMVEGWRRGLGRALVDELGESSLAWSEETAQPFFTARPDWLGWGALIFLAAYAEHPEMRRPRKPGRDWTEDPAWQASAAVEEGTPFQHLLFPELWLPVGLDLVFTAEDPDGNEVTIGSVPRLLEALRTLAAQTFGGDETEWALWRAAGLKSPDDFEANAKFGLATALAIVEQADAHGLCITLDY